MMGRRALLERAREAEELVARINAAEAALDRVPAAERLEILRLYCRGCGTKNEPGERPCQCENDE